jgi:hypothetical protein
MCVEFCDQLFVPGPGIARSLRLNETIERPSGHRATLAGPQTISRSRPVKRAKPVSRRAAWELSGLPRADWRERPRWRLREEKDRPYHPVREVKS